MEICALQNIKIQKKELRFSFLYNVATCMDNFSNGNIQNS